MSNLIILTEVIQERSKLLGAIDLYINSHYSFSGSSFNRLRRGDIQKEIIAHLNLPRTSFLCKLINERMAKRGFSAIRNRGDQYYNNITRLVSMVYELPRSP
jgi:hypothetical protein